MAAVADVAFALGPIEAAAAAPVTPGALRGHVVAATIPEALPSQAVGSSSKLASVAAVSTIAAAVAVSVRGRRRTRTARNFFSQSQPVEVTGTPKPLAIPALPAPGYRQVIEDPWAREIDAGFDPLNLATTESPFGGKVNPQETYFNYREAEVKHGRLAMLATLGWLSSEEFGPSLARQLGLKDLLAPGELAPSLVNGGLGNLPIWFLPSIGVISGLIDQKAPKPELYGKARVPGDVGFDPLGLQQGLKLQSGYDVMHLHNAEVKHGRAAMLGITGFVLQEFLFKRPVVQEDEIAADLAVSVVDKGIAALDKAAGLAVPQIPIPFPNP
eukprot:TRINITY_DN1640_c0_g1_i5.p1 TRINITY_DN1640_c0_g1~~TRINITY_DN1640_c0_g1_i5.p1  ORF type:complete len:328 (+),score=83.18 TRINITY_DN1640_c0_g1_i5:56-1039(+)